MQFTEELQKKLDSAQTTEEKKALLESIGVILSDEELEAVAGGRILGIKKNESEVNSDPKAKENRRILW